MTVEAVWRVEGVRIVATLTRLVGDVGLAEDLASEAVAEALERWPSTGAPANPGAWLTTVAKRRAIDYWRRRDRLDDRYRLLARDLTEVDDSEWEPLSDDVLRLIFVACHPVLTREAQVAMTLRVVGGLATDDIARLFLVSKATAAQRIVRAKKTLTAAQVPFEIPDPERWPQRLTGVLAVVYLMFSEGYSASSGPRVVRRELANEALRLGRMLAAAIPTEPEVHALVALMELQASRFAARVDADGASVLLADQDRSRWDRGQITRGLAALARSDAAGKSRGPYALQAAIAATHARARDVASTDWDHIVSLYEALEQLTRNPVVTVNRIVAVSMNSGPAAALELLDAFDDAPLRHSHLVPSVRGELLIQLGRTDEARVELTLAIERAGNDATRDVLAAKRSRLPQT